MLPVQRIDNKHHIEIRNDRIQIIKTTNDQPIDLEKEPVILFRGRDKLALPMLLHYRELCVQDGCTDFQLASMDDMIRRFEEFATQSPTMKQPGCTLGK